MAYQLEKYRGKSSRHTCPKCGKPHCFTYYVDEQGNVLDKSVGRCDHESGCGYHYPPKQFFEENPGKVNPSYPERRRIDEPPRKVEVHQPNYIPIEYVCRSRSNDSHLIAFLLSLHTDKEAVNRVLDSYRIGATRKADTIFWQIDKDNQVRTGKIIPYTKEDGHRIKEQGVSWVHSQLKKQGVLGGDWTLAQCLFGEHLLSLSDNRNKMVAVVESEKTALVCAIQYPDCVWLATGGKSQLSVEKMKVLAGRNVVFYPDVDGYQEWQERARAFSFCKSIKVSNVLERNASDADRVAKIDIADLILREWESLKRQQEQTPLSKAQRTIKMMTERNPALQILIDRLGLVPIVNDG